jgi:hypothetical protein
MRTINVCFRYHAALFLAVTAATACSRRAPPTTRGRDAVPLATDSNVFALIQQGRCDEAAQVLDGLSADTHDVQWFMRRGDTYICAFRKSKSAPARAAVISHFEAGLRVFPDSSRLMFEYGAACMAWDDLQAARTWCERARDLAGRRMATGQQAHGFDDKGAVKQQAEDLLRILNGG